MTALNCITNVKPKEIFDSLSQIMIAADEDSAITRDYAVKILINLTSIADYSQTSFSLLIEQLLTSPVNQLPMYAENTLPIINEQNKKKFISALSSRLDDIEKDSKQKCIERVIKKLIC